MRIVFEFGIASQTTVQFKSDFLILPHFRVDTHKAIQLNDFPVNRFESIQNVSYRTFEIGRIDLRVQGRWFNRNIDPGGIAPVQAGIGPAENRPIRLRLLESFK